MRPMKYQVESANHNVELDSSTGMDAAESFVDWLHASHGRACLGKVILVTELPLGSQLVVLTTHVLNRLSLDSEPMGLRLCK
jgi:hypothetical protein